jgi:NADH dehydrogenase
MYLIVGATGLVGGAVTRTLRERGEDVRALLRGDPTRPAAASLARAGVQFVSGDLSEPASLDGACAGVQTVVCTATSMPAAGGDALQRIDLDGVTALIDAAERAHVARFVYLSYSGGITIDSPLARAKRTCEARLSSSAMQTIVLRPTCFMEVWLGPHLGFDAQNARARIYGDGTQGMRYVSALDVAAFAIAAATHLDPLRDVVEIGGPEAVTQLEVVRIFERRMGRSFALEHVPSAALEAQYRSDDPLQKTFASLMLACANGDPVPAALASAERYGVTLTPVETFARRVVGGLA